MKTLLQGARTWITAGLLLAAAGLPAHGEDFAVNKPKTAERIDFKVDLQPLDPFSAANKVGAPREFNRGEIIRLVIEGAPRKGFHTYPLTRQYKSQAAYVSRFSVSTDDNIELVGSVGETPPPESVDEKEVGYFLEYEKPFTWIQELVIKRDVKPGLAHLRFTLDLTVCDASTCVPGKQEFDVPFTIIDGPPVESTPDANPRVAMAKSSAVELIDPPPSPPSREVGPKVVEPVKPVTTTPSARKAAGVWDLLAFMWQGVLWGALSLITPCVFPMIPITVSFFLKQSEKSAVPAVAGGPALQTRRPHSAILLAAIYSLTIALVLAVAGVLLLPLVQQFSQHWATNLVLGGLFVFFALSLFGMYDIVLPSSLGRLTAAGEGRGGLLGVVCMALTFTVISFACVAPFYGGFIALSASAASAADWLKLVLGALAFSVTFALPFFLLAMFPFLLKKLPKSGSWLNTVKVVMGFLELAAAFKFLRAAELNFSVHTEFLTYDLVLGVYVALSGACGLYLLGLFRLPHDHHPHETLTVPRLLFSIAFLGLGLYLLPGLFKTADGEQQRPQGTVFAWLDSFLLPEDSGPGSIAQEHSAAAPAGQLAWTGDLKEALKQAEAQKKLVFLDFTAETCTNCKYNERNVFPDRQVKSLLSQYVLVRLYTDNVPPGYQSSTTGEENHKFQEKEFQDVQLPLYAVLKPKDGGGFEIVGRYAEGKINNVDVFEKFLREPLQPPTADLRAEANGE